MHLHPYGISIVEQLKIDYAVLSQSRHQWLVVNRDKQNMVISHICACKTKTIVNIDIETCLPILTNIYEIHENVNLSSLYFDAIFQL